MLELGTRERQVLLGLSRNETGEPTNAPPLPAGDYGRAVVALRVLGLAGADYRAVHDDPDSPAVYFVDRLWLTDAGRELARAL